MDGSRVIEVGRIQFGGTIPTRISWKYCHVISFVYYTDWSVSLLANFGCQENRRRGRGRAEGGEGAGLRQQDRHRGVEGGAGSSPCRGKEGRDAMWGSSETGRGRVVPTSHRGDGGEGLG